MLQTTGSQRVRQDRATEQVCIIVWFCTGTYLEVKCCKLIMGKNKRHPKLSKHILSQDFIFVIIQKIKCHALRKKNKIFLN